MRERKVEGERAGDRGSRCGKLVTLRETGCVDGRDVGIP